MGSEVDYSKLTDDQLKAIAFGGRGPDALDKALSVPEEPSPSVRMGRGMMDFYQGSKQKFLNWTDKEEAKKYTRDVNDERARYKAGLDAVGETGFDPFRLAGNIATPLAAAPGGGVGLLGRAAMGALLGGTASYLNFSPENTPTGNAINTVVGATTGGLINAGLPVVLNYADRGLTAVGNKIGEGVRRLRQSISPNVNTEITNNVSIALNKAGVDFQKLVPQAQNVILNDAKEQLAKTGTLNAEQLLRKADIETVAGPGMATRAQVTRSPADWTAERNLQKVEVNLPSVQRSEQATLTDRLANQDEAMKRFGLGIGDKAYGGTPTASRAASPYQASERTVEAVKGAHEKLGEEVSQVYQLARQHMGAGQKLPADSVRQRVTDAITDFEDVMPGPIVNRLREFGLDGRWQGKATRELTVDDADKLLKLVNKRYSSADPAGKAAMDEVRGALKEVVFDAAKAGNEGAKRFTEAWSAARARFQTFEPKPLASIVEGKVNTANFLETNVLKGNPKDLAALKDVTTQNAGGQAWNDLRGQAWQWVLDKATQNGRGSFSGARFNDALKQIGPDRLKVLFPDELQQIMQLGRASEAMTYQPALSAVNNSNTTPALIGQLLRAGNRIPGLNLATQPISQEVQASATQKLLAKALDSSGAETSARDAAQAAARKMFMENILLNRPGYPALLAPAVMSQGR